AADRPWEDPVPPRRIHGISWYVGSCGISALLLTTPQGHVLIDGGLATMGRQIIDNIRTLGFKPEDVRYLLASHEHHDHVGGFAEIQQATGAPLMARAPAATTLRRGRSEIGRASRRERVEITVGEG